MGKVVELVFDSSPTIFANDNHIDEVALESYRITGDQDFKELSTFLKGQGIAIEDDRTNQEAVVVLRLMRGIRDRQKGLSDSDDYLYLCAIVQAIYEVDIPDPTDEFNEFLNRIENLTSN